MGEVFERHGDADASTVPDGGGGEPTPVGRSRYRPRSVHVLIAAGVMLVLAAGAVFAGGQLLIARYTGSVHQEHLLGGAAVTPSTSAGPKQAQVNGATNLLLVGTDEQADPAAGGRSDSIIIAHIPARHDRAYLISIPRDSRVDIPAFPRTGYPGGTDKINAAYAYGSIRAGRQAGGFELLALTIKQFTGISFDAGAILNFDGLRSVADAVGEVDMCVDEESALVHVGCQHFGGSLALAYARERKSIADGDYGRQRHQQQLVAALAKKIASTGMLADPLAADRALRAMGNAVIFDGNGTSLIDWILALRSIDPDTITMVKTNGGRYTTEVINGQDFEILTDTSRQLFSAVRDDTLEAFVAAHPDWVISNPKR
jgi:LCP family protein required for cell wall assembly